MNPCLNTSYVTAQCQQELICPICLQLMISPYRLTCGHTFGINCIKQWKNKQCPLCRQKYDQLTPQLQLKVKIALYMGSCKYCQTPLLAIHINKHFTECEQFLSQKKSQLHKICQKQRQILRKQITPHLQQVHAQIYMTYVDGWRWLENDSRDWKWWWWCKNPWWQNESCQQCNDLWHKYQQDIDILQVKRVQILAQIGPIQGLKKQQNQIQHDS